jgi:hypothetical protein
VAEPFRSLGMATQEKTVCPVGSSRGAPAESFYEKSRRRQYPGSKRPRQWKSRPFWHISCSPSAPCAARSSARCRWCSSRPKLICSISTAGHGPGRTGCATWRSCSDLPRHRQLRAAQSSLPRIGPLANRPLSENRRRKRMLAFEACAGHAVPRTNVRNPAFHTVEGY